MPRLTRRERFALSKCDRCGKATPARQNGISDLYVLDEQYGEGVADQGSFCLRCATRYSRENWLAWLAEHRAPTPETKAR